MQQFLLEYLAPAIAVRLESQAATSYVDLTGVLGTSWSLPPSVVAGKALSGNVSVVVQNIGNTWLPLGQQVNIAFVAQDTTTPANKITLATLSNQWISGMLAGGSATFYTYVNLPGGIAAGIYKVEAIITPVQALTESRTDNNTVTQNAVGFTEPLISSASKFVDLTGTLGSTWTLPSSAAASKPLTGYVSVVVQNIGNSALPAGQQVNIVFVAQDTTNAANKVTLATLSNQWVGSLAAGGSTTFSAYVNRPAGLTADTYQIEAIITPVQTLVESRTDNNTVLVNSLNATQTITVE
jgi:hypothetical protein